MNRRVFGALSAAIVLAALTPAYGAKDEFVPIFNGKDLSGFKFFLAGNAEPAKTFSVEDGYIKVSGKPNGYFYTDKSYKNYVIKFDWRFNVPDGKPEEPRINSGCLVHITGENKVWPKCIEVQGMYRDHAKLLRVSGAPATDIKDDNDARKKALKPLNEWNTTEVTVQDGKLSAKINGTPISSCTTTLTEGPIGFQSEGVEVHFKNMMIKEMK
jgi:hypothetical protein